MSVGILANVSQQELLSVVMIFETKWSQFYIVFVQSIPRKKKTRKKNWKVKSPERKM